MHKSPLMLACCAVFLVAGTSVGFAEPGSAPRPKPHLFPFCEERGKWGYMDRNGAVVINPRYAAAMEFSEGLALVCLDWDKKAFIDVLGRPVFKVPDTCDWVFPFSDGMARFLANEKYGYLDRKGNITVQPKYDDSGDFSEGLARVNVGAKPIFRGLPIRGAHGGKWGYLDKTGRVVIRAKYSEAADFSEGLASVTWPRGFGYVDKNGHLVFSHNAPPKGPGNLADEFIGHGSDFSEGLAAVTVPTGQHTAVPGELGETSRQQGPTDTPVAPHPAAESGANSRMPAQENPFSSFPLPKYVDKGMRTGFINRQGIMVIQPRFYSAGSFVNGLAFVETQPRWLFAPVDAPPTEIAYIDRTGRVVLPPRKLFTWEDDVADDHLAVVYLEEFGYMRIVDRRRETVVDPRRGIQGLGRINKAHGFSHGLALVHIGGELAMGGPWSGGTWYYINTEGRVVKRYCRDGEGGPGP